MSLNIKNDDAESAARELAAQTGETVTGAIAVAVRERLDRLRRADATGAAERATRIQEISRDTRWRWVDPARTAEHGDLLYDERGLPR